MHNVRKKRCRKDITTNLCDRDQYLPAYFIPPGTKEHNAGQIIQWLPQAENKGVGSMWNGFCNENDDGKGSRQLFDKDAEKNSKNKIGKVNANLVDPRQAGNKTESRAQIRIVRLLRPSRQRTSTRYLSWNSKATCPEGRRIGA
ncbi:hypothetical protein K469DRAFT_80614 [Zopfia rhizophila CBS 207.26]|uniref:Uncharacterized protein n=1 Tax=Zopfia rhizophila CBS 207.26 TaxID=1314779 RepID=A0A6A6DAX7_9PEZI|nr:hypothetical protein K469DRAFT_80614 [Zopfia rhizophila CBS 207.26]